MPDDIRSQDPVVDATERRVPDQPRPKTAADSAVDRCDHADDLFDDTVSPNNAARAHGDSGMRTVVDSTAKSSQTDSTLPTPRIPVDHHDPLSGRQSIHPVGTSVGAATGAAAGAAAGAAIGATMGPIGAALGAAAGAIAAGFAGGAAGRRVAETINPSTEDHYWRTAYAHRPYIRPGTSYEAYRPAYLFGVQTRLEHCEKTWSQAESLLQAEWEQSPDSQKLPWTLASPAVHDAWDKLTPCDPDL